MASTTDLHRSNPARALPPTLIDIAIVVGALAGTLALLRHGGVAATGPGAGGLDLTGVVLAAGSSVPILARRRYPLGVFIVTATAGVLLTGLGYPGDLVLGPIAAVYLLAASRTRQSPWTGRTTAVVLGFFAASMAVAAEASGTPPALSLLHAGLAWSVAWFAGERTRLRREQMIELLDRAARAERDAERERQLGVAEERTRIARDLHDSAGHAINVITVRAGAARLRHDQDPQRSLLALQAIEDLARATANEIDEIVGTLRNGETADGEIVAPSGLASVGALIEHHTQSGLRVTVDTAGVPAPLSRTTDQAAYRILQQALNNAARHGCGQARVRLEYADRALALTITNPVDPRSAPRTGGGHGLIGMRERATLLGGTLETTQADGTFRVEATIPYRGDQS